MTELSLNNLRINKRKKSKRVGRGNASGVGTYSGRGLKGQKARSGGKGGLKRKGLSRLLRNKPKLGGFKSLNPKPAIVDLSVLAKNFESGELVNDKTLIAKGLIRSKKDGIKVLGAGPVTKKLNVFANSFSESAKKAIIDAGGQATIVARSKKYNFKKSKSKKTTN